VRARDRAGKWSAVATYPLHLDLHPASFAQVAFASTAFDPDVEREHIAVTLGSPAHLQATIIREDTGMPVRTSDLGEVRAPSTLAWDGRDDRGHPAQDGSYRFVFTATDRYGQHATADYSGIYLTRRRLVISLRLQRMVAYDGKRAVARLLVTTGNRALPTPLGVFHIILKRHPFTFVSPWPQTSPLYYPPSPVQFALLFSWSGFYIHDAPWRSVFGPGSNARVGTPGLNYTGTHGCINVPASLAAWIYDWAPVGTVVQVVA
jgi:lipoprotein-anchoring transpeptidase ErfK/SrfK